jgi:hypothetical protein
MMASASCTLDGPYQRPRLAPAKPVSHWRFDVFSHAERSTRNPGIHRFSLANCGIHRLA